MIKRLVFLCIVAVLSLSGVAQELKCNVTVNTSLLQGTNKQTFETLQKALNDFMNNYKFTDMVYATNERINCNFLITVKSVENDIYNCELQVQASRPVYGTAYSTVLFNFKDQTFNFRYVEFDPIEINNNTFDSNLTAVLAYYAYVIIGMDLDSFSKLGGTPVFQSAEQIVNVCQSKGDGEWSGWKAFESDRNRYALMNNIMDERFRKFREFYYEYHRQALDNMITNVENSRAKIATGLPILRDTYRERPGAILILAFLDAKNDELINIFSKKGLPQEKTAVYEILMDVNPSAGTRYEQIKQ